MSAEHIPDVGKIVGGEGKEQQETIDRINAMSHFEMCVFWRHAPAGHPYFDRTLPFAEVFEARLFKHFGGFTPAISKALTP